MPTPREHKTVQARILEYAEAIGWTFVSRQQAERRRGFDPEVPLADRARNRSLFFDDLLDAKVREFNPRYSEAALLRQVRHWSFTVLSNWSRKRIIVKSPLATNKAFMRHKKHIHVK